MTARQLFTVTSPAPRDVWQEIYQADPNHLIFQSPAWTEALCVSEVYRDASRLYETTDGRQWLLPLVAKGKMLLSQQASFPPGWGLGGILADHPLRPENVSQVLADVEALPVTRTVIHPNPFLTPIWEAGKIGGVHSQPRLWHVLDLEGGFDQVWAKRFQPVKRTAIRKAEHANLTVAWDATGKWIPIFYAIYMDWASRRGKERHIPETVARWTNRRREPQERLQHIARVLGDECRVYVVWLGQQAVAAAILLMDPDNAFFYRGTSLWEAANPVRANDLLQRVMIEDACQAGCRHYYMGESGGVASLMRFKRGFGAVATPFTSYSVERLPLLSIQSSLYHILKQLEVRLIHPAA